jgi:hypothetical protein
MQGMSKQDRQLEDPTPYDDYRPLQNAKKICRLFIIRQHPAFRQIHRRTTPESQSHTITPSITQQSVRRQANGPD